MKSAISAASNTNNKQRDYQEIVVCAYIIGIIFSVASLISLTITTYTWSWL